MHRMVISGILLGAAAAAPALAQPTAPKRLPVYRVAKAGLTAAEAERLQRAFGLKNLARDEAGVARFLDENGFLRVPTAPAPAPQDLKREEGEFDKPLFERFDVDALRKLKVPARAQALSAAQKALKEANAIPAGAVATAIPTRFEIVDHEGKVLADQALDMAVSYRFRLGALPLEGPGAKIRVAYGPGGQVTQLIHATRRLVPAGDIAVLGRKEGSERCASWSYRGSGGVKARVVAADLAYYAPPLSEKLERLEPSYRCRLAEPSGAVSQVFFVPAAVDAKRPPLPEPQQPRPTVAQAAMMIPRIDVGGEGTGPCSGLPWTGTNVTGFINRMAGAGVPGQFTWLDANAWEDDFKDPSLSGHDSDWVDDVDMAYWQGHGWPFGFSFAGCSSIDDDSLVNTDARWGNRDAEWMSLFTCLVLAEEDGGQRWWQRWGPAFQGLHQINSFHTVSYHSAQHGGIYADYLTRTPFLWWNNPLKVRDAWAQTSIDDQPSDVVWASMGPIGAGGLVNYNDYFWGKGPVGPDVPASQITGYWRISGGS